MVETEYILICLLCVFSASLPYLFRQIARYPPQKIVQICSTIHHNISDDQNLNSFLFLVLYDVHCITCDHKLLIGGDKGYLHL